MQDLRAAMLPLLTEQLQPIHAELRAQSQILARLMDEVVNLQIFLGNKEKTQDFDGNKSFADLRTARKTLHTTRPASGEAKLKAEEVKNRKSEAAREQKETELKRKAAEMHRKEEEKTAKEKSKKEAEGKRAEMKKEQEEEMKRKREEVRAKPRPASDAKANAVAKEETKKRIPGSKLLDRKSLDTKELPSDKEIRVSPLLAASEDPVLPPEIPEILEILSKPVSLPSIPLPVLLQLPKESDLGSDPRCIDIDMEIKSLYKSHSQQVLTSPTGFALSLGAKSGLCLLNSLDNGSLYITSEPVREEVYWVFRLFFQLLGQTLSDVKSEMWAICREFIETGKTNNLENHILQACDRLDFSEENVDKVERLLGEKWDRVNPNLYSTFCQLSSLVMFVVKEALVYAGLVPDKAAPWRKCQRLLHKRQLALGS